MANEEQVKEEEVKEEPSAADKILEEVRAKLEKSEKKEEKVPSSQPASDANKAANDYRETMKKQMNWTDAQFDTYQRDKAVSQAPMVSELSKTKVREAHKDFDSLREPYEAEYKKYTDQGIAVGADLAEQIFWMVKGREVDAGRYKAPDSQPKAKTPSGGGRNERIAPAYNPAAPSLGGKDKEEDEAAGQLTDEEKQYARIAGVSEKGYATMREEKKQGRREITQRTVRVPEIDVKSAGAADRDLFTLMSKHGGGKV